MHIRTCNIDDKIIVIISRNAVDKYTAQDLGEAHEAWAPGPPQDLVNIGPPQNKFVQYLAVHFSKKSSLAIVKTYYGFWGPHHTIINLFVRTKIKKFLHCRKIKKLCLYID